MNLYYDVMMKLPEITPQNYSAIYSHFDDIEVNKHIQNFVFSVMHAVYKSDVYYEDGASETIKEHTQNGGSAILVPNHHSNADTPTIAGLVYEDTFSALKGTTIIPAKASLFTNPLTRWFVPHMLAHPTFRRPDYTADSAPELRQEVTNALIQFNIDHLDNGGNDAIFAESKRNRTDPRIVQPLKSGIARIALGVQDPLKLLIVPLGFAYRTNHKILKLNPVVSVGMPFSPLNMSHDELLHETRSRMQTVTTASFNRI